MLNQNDNYWCATKHPWACVLFVLPLLAIYEVGIFITGVPAPEELRNGADVWLRSALRAAGLTTAYAAPCLLVIVLLFWGLLQREHRPLDKLGVWIGMAAESAAYAVLLLGLSQALWHILVRADHILGQPSHRIAVLQWNSDATGTTPESVWGQIISYLGAGIYEETLFRLMLFAGLLRLLAWSDAPSSLVPFALAAFASALVFAGAHHIGPNGDPFNVYVLCFRTCAGIYFAWLFNARGFGIAVGAHAGYDVLVGLILQPA